MALDAIEELCFEMSLHRPEAMEEYAIFVVTHRGKAPDASRLTVPQTGGNVESGNLKKQNRMCTLKMLRWLMTSTRFIHEFAHMYFSVALTN